MTISAEDLISKVKFDEKGLVPVVVQDAVTGSVRMVAWANREALERTASSGLGCFFSRSRQSLWTKGETSGNVLRMREMRIDCDADVVLYLVDASGPSCHTGATSCFFRVAAPEGGLRQDDGPPDLSAAVLGRVARLLGAGGCDVHLDSSKEGWQRMADKIRQGTAELAGALPAGDGARIAREAAEVFFQVLVGLQAAGVSVEAVWAELSQRFPSAEQTARSKPDSKG